MKTILKLFKCTFLCTALFLFSCNEDENLKEKQNNLAKKISLQEENLTKNMDVSLLNRPLIFESKKFIFQITDGKTVTLMCETKDYYNIFILQTEGVKKDAISDIQISKVIYLDHIMIASTDKGNYYFSVKNRNAERIQKMIPKNQNYIAKIYGYGLIYNKIKKEELDDPSLIIDELTTDISSKVSYLHLRGCNSGGEGSSSCSIDGCFVSCDPGYYACCNHGLPDSCKCIKEAFN